jgi:small nuclear ribonucleoprotein (snRNP)-like protein
MLAITSLNSMPLFAGGDEGFIFGKITMKNGNTYEGVIRWGKEEAFWDDIFNSSKVASAVDLYLTDEQIENLESEFDSRSRRGRRRRWWGRDDWPDAEIHQFKCRFGDLKKIEMLRGNDVLLTLKNGDEIEVSGGSNDVNTNLKILDAEVGEVELKWDRIESVEFMPTPKNLQRKFGDPLYGEVVTGRGNFQGFIQWDHEECLTTDKLDGHHEDGKMSIEFGKIKKIENRRRGSLVTLKSGRELYLEDSNDVNDENRGVVIKEPRFGKVLVRWHEFEEVTFDDEAKGSGPAYKDFGEPKALMGSVKTEDEETFSGRIIYDIDEGLDLELLDGEDGGIQYRIAFRDIRKIIPRGRHSAIIELRNGEELRLEESRDVTRDNDGILVVDKEDKVSFIPWSEVSEIKFN